MAQEEWILPAELFMDLDRAGPMPLYYQVATRLEAAIEKGDLPPGTRLESELALGARLGLSRPTVRRAIQELVDKGLLVRRRAIGTQVVQGRVTRGVELTSLYEDLQKSNQKPTTTVLLHEVIGADAAVATTLAAPLGSPVLHLKRLRLAGKTPIAVLENYLPGEFIDLGAEDLAKYGLYQLMRARGVTMSVARQTIGARRSTPAESEILTISRDAPVLTMHRTAYDNSGRAVEVGHHCYRPDLYSFEMTLVQK